LSSAKAFKLCPNAIFVRGRFDAYREASEQVRKIFLEYTDLVQPVSIDEAYLDVTSNKKNIKSATQIAREIRQKIFETTKLTASAGVSYNKFLSKIGSDMDKPDGLVVIPPDKAAEILENLPIRKFHGIGKAGEKNMKKIGIKNGADLKKWSLKDLIKHFGKMGSHYYYIVRGIDNSEVTTDRIRKSLGNERTFAEDINDKDKLIEFLEKSADKISQKMKKDKFHARTLTLKIKYANFDVITKSKTLLSGFNDLQIIRNYSRELLLENFNEKRKIRLLGISVSNLVWENDKKNEQIILSFYHSTPILLE
ncbi:DNA polymerase IV, partial [bacterium]|nr:DNA polymerase IV [bacterium]